MGVGAVLMLLTAFGTLSSQWLASSSINRGGGKVICHDWLISMEDLPFSEEKGRRIGWGKVGRVEVRTDRSGGETAIVM